MSDRILSVLTLHGIGTPPADYAAKAMARMHAALKKRGIGLHHRSVWYDPILDAASRAFERDQHLRGMDRQPTTRIADHTLSDALVGTNAKVQERIFDLIDVEYMKLRTDEVVIISHSMGCKHALDWLRSRELARCANLVTMACNTALWYLDAESDSGSSVPVPRQVAKGGKWLNVVEKDDMLGRFMEGATGGAAIDLEVKLGGWFSWSGASHVNYWSDKRLFSKTLPGLLAL